MTKTRQEINQECNSGSYGSGVGTYAFYLVLIAVVTVVLRFIC